MRSQSGPRWYLLERSLVLNFQQQPRKIPPIASRGIGGIGSVAFGTTANPIHCQCASAGTPTFGSLGYMKA